MSDGKQIKVVSLVAELNVLRGLCNKDRKVNGTLLSNLTEDFFYHKTSKALYRHLRKHIEKVGEAPAYDVLMEDPSLSDDCRDLFSRSTKEVVNTVEEAHNAIRVLNHYRQIRGLVELAQSIPFALREEDTKLDKVINDVTEKINTIKSVKCTKDSFLTFGKGNNSKDFVHSLLFDDNTEALIPTGYQVFDSVSGGFPRQGLVTIGANSGMGKSLLACDMAVKMASQGYRVVFVPLEMSKQEMTSRIIANVADVDLTNVTQNKRLSEEEKTQAYKKYVSWAKGCSKKGGSLTIFKPEEDVDIDDIFASVASYKPDVLFVDYISLLKGLDGDDQWLRLGSIARRAKINAEKEHRVNILLCQVNDDGKIRYARSISEHSNTSWIWTGNQETKETGVVKIDQPKSRNAKAFSFFLKFEYNKMRVTDLAQNELDNEFAPPPVSKPKKEEETEEERKAKEKRRAELEAIFDDEDDTTNRNTNSNKSNASTSTSSNTSTNNNTSSDEEDNWWDDDEEEEELDEKNAPEADLVCPPDPALEVVDDPENDPGMNGEIDMDEDPSQYPYVLKRKEEERKRAELEGDDEPIEEEDTTDDDERIMMHLYGDKYKSPEERARATAKKKRKVAFPDLTPSSSSNKPVSKDRLAKKKKPTPVAEKVEEEEEEETPTPTLKKKRISLGTSNTTSSDNKRRVSSGVSSSVKVKEQVKKKVDIVEEEEDEPIDEPPLSDEEKYAGLPPDLVAVMKHNEEMRKKRLAIEAAKKQAKKTAEVEIVEEEEDEPIEEEKTEEVKSVNKRVSISESKSVSKTKPPTIKQETLQKSNKTKVKDWDEWLDDTPEDLEDWDEESLDTWCQGHANNSGSNSSSKPLSTSSTKKSSKQGEKKVANTCSSSSSTVPNKPKPKKPCIIDVDWDDDDPALRAKEEEDRWWEDDEEEEEKASPSKKQFKHGLDLSSIPTHRYGDGDE